MSRSRPQIGVGSRVVVLNGRHFPSFGAGDEGTVLEVNAEASNCQVRFDNRPKPVQVALRHLGLASSPSPSRLEGDSFGASETPRSTPQRRRRADRYSDPDDSRNDDIEWSGLTSLLNPEVQHFEPCDYMDSTAGFAAGLAAVSAATSNQTYVTNGFSRTTLAPGALMGLDLNNGGYPDVILAGANGVRGANLNTLPAVQQVLFAGEAQQHTRTQPEQTYQSMIEEPTFIAGPNFTPACQSFEPARPATPKEHYTDQAAEVASLGRALEQCIGAISMCARAIDGMCASNALISPRGGDVYESWKEASAALHEAASVGMKALNSKAAPSVTTSINQVFIQPSQQPQQLANQHEQQQLQQLHASQHYHSSSAAVSTPFNQRGVPGEDQPQPVRSGLSQPLEPRQSELDQKQQREKEQLQQQQKELQERWKQQLDQQQKQLELMRQQQPGNVAASSSRTSIGASGAVGPAVTLEGSVGGRASVVQTDPLDSQRRFLVAAPSTSGALQASTASLPAHIQLQPQQQRPHQMPPFTNHLTPAGLQGNVHPPGFHHTPFGSSQKQLPLEHQLMQPVNLFGGPPPRLSVPGLHGLPLLGAVTPPRSPTPGSTFAFPGFG